jgi:lauroyl/myristoyl acyltransferase
VAQNRWIEDTGSRWVRQPASYGVLRDLLLRGEVVWIAVDSRGSTETTLLGRRVRLGSGPGRLAAETGAVVVPVFALRRGRRHVVEIRRPLDAPDDPQIVTDRLAEIVGDVALAYPEQVHDALLRVLR